MFTKTMLHTFISLFLIALTACAALPTSGAAVSPARSQGGKSPVTVEASTASSPTAASQSETSPASTLAAQPVPAEAPAAATQAGDLTYPIVDTGQTACYDAGGAIAACPPKEVPSSVKMPNTPATRPVTPTTTTPRQARGRLAPSPTTSPA
jgi:hypothetical protein